ncbi:MAG TPA: hypothetical protein VEO56_11390, partial [Bacteroidota bacterium]|nr:hypothetical protein [Bacteroidota bacterium]
CALAPLGSFLHHVRQRRGRDLPPAPGENLPRNHPITLPLHMPPHHLSRKRLAVPPPFLPTNRETLPTPKTHKPLDLHSTLPIGIELTYYPVTIPFDFCLATPRA